MKKEQGGGPGGVCGRAGKWGLVLGGWLGLLAMGSVEPATADSLDLFVSSFGADSVTFGPTENLFVSNFGADSVTFDPTENLFASDFGANSVTFGPTENLFVSNFGANSVTFDPTENLFASDFGANSVTFGPTENLFVSNFGANSVTFGPTENLFASNFGANSVTFVTPEPASLLLVASGVGGLAVARRRAPASASAFCLESRRLRFSKKIFARLPEGVLTLAGKLLYRHIG